jgi:hypothetical protein
MRHFCRTSLIPLVVFLLGCVGASLIAYAAATDPAFQQGAADRQQWENWFGSLTGEYRRGAEFWAGQRSQPHPGSCYGPNGQDQGEFTAGCLAAQTRLSPMDARRKSEPSYKAGFNSYSSSSASVAPPQAAEAQVWDNGYTGIGVPRTDPKTIGKPYGLEIDPACSSAAPPIGIGYAFAHCDLLDNPEQISHGPVPGPYPAGPGTPGYAIRDRMRSIIKLPQQAINVQDRWWWEGTKIHYCLDWDTVVESETLPTALWPRHHHHECHTP